MISSLCVVALFGALMLGWRYPGVLIAGTFFTYIAGALSSHGWVGSLYVGLAAGMAGVQYVLRPHRIRLNAIDFTLYGLTLFLCFSEFWSSYPDDTIAMSGQLLLSVIGMYAIARLQRTPLPRLLNETNAGIVVLGAIMAVGMLAERVTGGSYAENTRLLISNEDASAVGMTQPLPFAMFAAVALLFFSRSWVLRGMAVGSLGIVAYTSVVAATRSVFLSVIVAAVLTLVIGARRIPFKRYLLGGLAALGGMVVMLFALPQAQIETSLDRLLGNFGSGGLSIDASGEERLTLYSVAENLFLDHPIYGAAYGTFSHYTFQSYPHNLFLEIASAGGLIGVMLLVAWLLITLGGIFRIYRWDPASGAIIFGYFCVAFVQLQVSFAFFMARPLFLIGALVAVYAATATARSRFATAPRSPNGARRQKLRTA